MGVLNLSPKGKEEALRPITIDGLTVSALTSLSIHAEYTNGKNSLSWCIWEQEHYGFHAPIYLRDAGKISHSKAIGPDIENVIEAIAPNQIIYLYDDPLVKKAMASIPAMAWRRSKLNNTLMSDETLMKAKETLSQERFKVAIAMAFEPDLIFDEDFNYCTIGSDAINHNDTTLLISKACAVGCLYFDWWVNHIWWR